MGAPSAPSIISNVTTPTSNMIAQSVPEIQFPILGPRASDMQPNIVNLEERVQMKPVETVGPPYADTTVRNKGETEVLRSQINEADILNDMAQARITAQELRSDTLEKEKKSNE